MENNGHKEKEILELIPKENSWEQIIYQVVAINDLDPWNLDLNALSRGFAEYIASIEELDFRVPAKWIMIAAVLLRMKSDYIKVMKMDSVPQDEFMDLNELEDAEIEDIDATELQADDVEPIGVTARRKPVRRITVTELVDSLRRVLASEHRRELKVRKARGKISIRTDDIAVRIDKLYSRISDMLNGMRDKKVAFSSVVDKWERGSIIDHFMPLMHLDNQRKVECAQKEIFDEIFIRKKAAS
jgi:chromatin segregation and condensation protein Rec8/ScpA/Scc1 (kleisin family)